MMNWIMRSLIAGPQRFQGNILMLIVVKPNLDGQYIFKSVSDAGVVRVGMMLLARLAEWR